MIFFTIQSPNIPLTHPKNYWYWYCFILPWYHWRLNWSCICRQLCSFNFSHGCIPPSVFCPFSDLNRYFHDQPNRYGCLTINFVFFVSALHFTVCSQTQKIILPYWYVNCQCCKDQILQSLPGLPDYCFIKNGQGHLWLLVAASAVWVSFHNCFGWL